MIELASDLSAGGIAVPPAYRDKAPEVVPLDAPAEGATDAQKASAMPRPTGWRLLCVVPKRGGTFEGTSIVKAEEVVRVEESTSLVLFVMDMGPRAYQDKEKFPSGPWCKKGDFIMVRAYAGTRFRVFGQEFRIISDEQVDAVVEDPRGITAV